MPEVLRGTLTWAWAYVQHVTVMFYWFWIPGVLVLGLVGTRYRSVSEEITRKQREGAKASWAAIGWGMTSGAGRRTGLDTARTLRGQGFSDHLVLAYLVASQNLGLYSLLLFTLLIGLEFGLGVFLGGLVMIGLLRVLAPARAPGRMLHADALEAAAGAPSPAATWMALVGSVEGWGSAVRDVGRYVRHVGLSLIGGLILGALILTIDSEGYWVFPKWMGDETLGAALASSFLAPLLSLTFFLAPGGNLIVVSSIWKTWTLTYSGVISLVLASLLNPMSVRILLRHHGGSRGWLLVLAIYLSAALSGLAVAGLFALLGVQVTHVPWFRDLVDKLLMLLPFTMLGAPGDGMQGM